MSAEAIGISEQRRLRHDVWNALSGLEGSLSLLEEQCADCKRSENLLQSASSACQTLRALLSEMFQSGETAPVPQDCSWRELAGSILAQSTAEARKRHVRVDLEIHPNLPPVPAAKRLALTRILANLVSNAIKFTIIGDIHVRIRRIEQPAASVQIIVADTGIGIPDAEQPLIFQENYRGRRAEVLAEKGSGLGLKTVQDLTTELGGQIHLQSRVGHGSTFTVTVPLGDH